MAPELIFYIGIAVCSFAAAGAIVAAIALRLSKARLNKRFDIEYGKRRH